MRPAEPAEESAVVDFLEGMEEGLAARVLAGLRLGVVERDGVTFVALRSREMDALPAALLDGADAGGLPIGTLEDGGFHLDLQGAVQVARFTKAQSVRVTEHAARLFLYGRNILGDSVEWHDRALEKGDACIVANPRGEALGIGVVVGSFKGNREAVQPVHDLGTYLRDQDEGE
ncbi:MAG: ribosome subunit biosis protein [Thermoplasmata archaeon]|jgi:ribosome biogenesis protein Nip4|nr:ribosome subunit biosis protein [Thermoplasmata archaeon]